MEGFGIADAAWVANIGYLVVRGTCDYCNSTKNDIWHPYAALIAAAYTCTIIEYLHPGGSSSAPKPAPMTAVSNVLDTAAQADVAMTAVAEVPDSAEAASVLIKEENTGSGHGPQPPTSARSSLIECVQAVTIPDPLAPASADAGTAEAAIAAAAGIRDLIVEIDALLNHLRWKETASLAADLERHLQRLPRRGNDVRDGWLLLARLESQRLQDEKQAGRAVDLTRLRALRQEAENV